MKLVDRLGDTCQWFKVGMELYYAAGNRIVQQLRDRGFNVFLDLKLHDIPNTVAGAVRSATQAGASLLTIHASGGAAMMSAAAEAARAPGSPRLLAVTVLTSMDASELAGIGITAISRRSGPPPRQTRPGLRHRRHGLLPRRGRHPAKRDRPRHPARHPRNPPRRQRQLGDQKRIATPAEAIADGASLLVVGRPITRAADPAAGRPGDPRRDRTASPHAKLTKNKV